MCAHTHGVCTHSSLHAEKQSPYTHTVIKTEVIQAHGGHKTPEKHKGARRFRQHTVSGGSWAGRQSHVPFQCD